MSDSVRPQRRQPTRLLCPWDSPGKNTGVGCHFLLQCMKVKSEREVAQSCPTLSDPMDCSPPGSPSLGFSRQEHWSGGHRLLSFSLGKCKPVLFAQACIPGVTSLLSLHAVTQQTPSSNRITCPESDPFSPDLLLSVQASIPHPHPSTLG